MLYREIIAVCYDIRIKRINTVCGQNVEFMNVKLAVHKAISRLLRDHKLDTSRIARLFDVITSFFSGYMFGGGTTAHRHTRTVPHDVTAGV